MVVALAARAAFELVLEIDRAARRLAHRLDRHLRKLRAAEIGVEHRAGEVEYQAQQGLYLPLDAPDDLRQDDLLIRFRCACGAQFRQDGADRLGDRGPTVPVNERLASCLPQQAVDGRKRGERSIHGGGGIITSGNGLCGSAACPAHAWPCWPLPSWRWPSSSPPAAWTCCSWASSRLGSTCSRRSTPSGPR